MIHSYFHPRAVLNGGKIPRLLVGKKLPHSTAAGFFFSSMVIPILCLFNPAVAGWGWGPHGAAHYRGGGNPVPKDCLAHTPRKGAKDEEAVWKLK